MSLFARGGLKCPALATNDSMDMINSGMHTCMISYGQGEGFRVGVTVSVKLMLGRRD